MKKVLKNQGYHLLAYLVFSFILLYFTVKLKHSPAAFWGLNIVQWQIFAWVFAGVFQAWVLFFWRLELYYKSISRIFGAKGFPIFRAGFTLLFILRFLPLVFITRLSKGAFTLNPFLKWLLIIVPSVFILWAIYSVIFYFGFKRLAGADHFFKEYQKPLKARGIFKYIPNSIYFIIFLLAYLPGILKGSSIALISAFIQHLFVWVHYYCTEKPDLKQIYGSKE